MSKSCIGGIGAGVNPGYLAVEAGVAGAGIAPATGVTGVAAGALMAAGAATGALAGAGLLVNTTSLGMGGQPALDLPLDDLPVTALVNDIVYTPLETGLLAAARARGNPVVDGLGMLLHQGRPGFEAWFGVAPDVTPELRAAVLA